MPRSGVIPGVQSPSDDLFHEGERQIQRRAGVADVARRVGQGALQSAIDPEFAAFLQQRLFLVAVEEVFGNCTKYIGQRIPVEVIGGGRTDQRASPARN